MPHRPPKSTFDIYREGGTTRDISLLIKLVLMVRRFRNQLDEALRRIDQSTARMEMLSAILNMQGPKSQTDLARRLRVEAATVTRMIDILGKEGLVERTPDPNDRRVNLLSISPKGEAVLAEIFRVYDRLRSHLLQDLSADDVEQMHAMIDLMTARLDEPEPAAQVVIEPLESVDRLRS
ncbi:MarR family transcriptional regulator [Altererythrobacter soli]|uniref:MarR family transcriptional regulator n=1 Tax=Croceibacterium soli TaxID=1739690 RepID=A0A6I4UUK5_9SPHN|nr:MarR family transcriptional regulator [Croceibacterium soli]MXP41484.1 MarR family transcriptional regulator [Croceibacterium soli]